MLLLQLTTKLHVELGRGSLGEIKRCPSRAFMVETAHIATGRKPPQEIKHLS